MRTTPHGFALAVLAAFATLTSQPVVSQPSETPDTLRFECSARDRAWTLEAVTVRTSGTELVSDRQPLVRWNRDRSSDTMSFRQCRDAAQQLQLAVSRGTLEYLTLGRVDGQLVLCMVEDRRSGCNEANVVAIVPETGRNAQTVMSQLFDLDFLPPEPQCDIDEMVYLDVRTYLARDPELPVSCRCYCGVCACPR
ncbi:MAG: hypothetical protein J7641_11135 [Cyanobacteria bacterium SID2]|nr:hypothetical protein [Cyanobacteria bacterium SID2]MBP0005689.1 hypothetical protein [Cyanobacteria bacterium SBC]